MAHPVSFPIEAAKRTVLAPARFDRGGVEFPDSAEWNSAGVAPDAVRRTTESFASECMRHVNVELVRNTKKVVEFAVVRSDKLPVSVTVFAPEFAKQFEEVFGQRMKILIPNRHTVFVFPDLTVNFEEHAPMILEAWRSRSPRVSLEAFELKSGRLKAIGRIEEP